jgi:hypothetical protein
MMKKGIGKGLGGLKRMATFGKKKDDKDDGM